jgi:glucose-6-phosphate-specific signal transduction histidine kinase
MSHAEEIEDKAAVEIGWLEIFLVVAGLLLVLQVWPNFYVVPARAIFAGICFVFAKTCVILAPLDVRQWGWRSYAVANLIAFIALAIARFRSI